MSDISTSATLSMLSEHHDQDNLSHFLRKLTQFSLDQCSQLTRLISDKQQTGDLGSASTGYSGTLQEQQHPLDQLLIDGRRLQNELGQFLCTLSSSNDQNKQLLFQQLQTYLSKLFAMNVRFQSIDDSKNVDQRHRMKASPASERTLHLSMVDRDLSSSASMPSPTTSSSSQQAGLGKCWKFANILRTRFEMSLIAANSQTILCYHQQTNLLHFILLTGKFQDNVKWKHEPISDLLWSSLIERYLAVTRHSIFTIQYDRPNHTVVAHPVLDVNPSQTVRLACNQEHILVYSTNEQSSTIQIYDQQFHREQQFDSNVDKHLPINSPAFGCTNKFVALVEKDNVSISYFPYVTQKKISLLLFDIDTLALQFTIDLNHAVDLYSMKCSEQANIFFVLTSEKNLSIVEVDADDAIQTAQKKFYTNQTEMCVVNGRDLLLINVNAGHAIQLVKYRSHKS